MKILIKTNISGIYGSFTIGQEVELVDEIAENFVENGVAVKVESEGGEVKSETKTAKNSKVSKNK